MSMPAPGRWRGAELLVAMAAVPIPGPEALPNLEADVYRFQLDAGAGRRCPARLPGEGRRLVAGALVALIPVEIRMHTP